MLFCVNTYVFRTKRILRNGLLIFFLGINISPKFWGRTRSTFPILVVFETLSEVWDVLIDLLVVLLDPTCPRNTFLMFTSDYYMEYKRNSNNRDFTWTRSVCIFSVSLHRIHRSTKFNGEQYF